MGDPTRIHSALRFTCQGTGLCCQSFAVPATETERRRIVEERKAAEAFPELAGRTLFRRIGGTPEGPLWQIVPDALGRCPFLDEALRCKLHARFGPEAKPLACRAYPYTFVRAPDGVHVGLRWSCPTAARGLGERVADDRAPVRGVLREPGFEAPRIEEPVDLDGAEFEWGEVQELEEYLARPLGEKELPFGGRVALLLDAYDLLAASRGRGGEGRSRLWDALYAGLLAKAKGRLAGGAAAGAGGPRPGWLDRLLVRQVAALFLHGGGGELLGMPLGARLRHSAASLARGVGFLVGRGSIPAGRGAHPRSRAPFLAAVPFARVRAIGGGVLDADPDGDLARYYEAKIRAQQFFGPLCYGLPFGVGVRFLALALPCIGLYARAAAARAGRDAVHQDDLLEALQTVDYGYGSSPVFGGLLGRLRLRLAGARDTARRFAHALAAGGAVL